MNFHELLSLEDHQIEEVISNNSNLLSIVQSKEKIRVHNDNSELQKSFSQSELDGMSKLPLNSKELQVILRSLNDSERAAMGKLSTSGMKLNAANKISHVIPLINNLVRAELLRDHQWRHQVLIDIEVEFIYQSFLPHVSNVLQNKDACGFDYALLQNDHGGCELWWGGMQYCLKNIKGYDFLKVLLESPGSTFSPLDLTNIVEFNPSATPSTLESHFGSHQIDEFESPDSIGSSGNGIYNPLQHAADAAAKEWLEKLGSTAVDSSRLRKAKRFLKTSETFRPSDGSPAAKRTKRIRNHINQAIDKITKADSAAGKHLDDMVMRGSGNGYHGGINWKLNAKKQ